MADREDQINSLLPPAGASPSPDKLRVPGRRWGIAWLLALGVLVNYFDRVNLSVSQAALVDTFHISFWTFGLLSAAYNWTYALCQLPVGVLLDRFGVRRIGRVSTLLWSLASFAAAVAPGLGAFFGARLLLGVGEAPTFPANAKAIGRWFPPSERSFATSIFDSAAKFASAIGVPLIGLLLLRVGWRWSFAATGLISLLYFVLFFRLYRDPEEDPGLSLVEREYIQPLASPLPILGRPSLSPVLQEQIPLRSLLAEPKVLGLAIGFGSYNYIFYLLLTWLPSYLSHTFGMDLRRSFLYTGVPWLYATATDMFVGGWLADWLIKQGYNPNRVRQTILIGGTACGLGLLGAAHAHTPTVALLWISLSIGGLAAAAPIGWSIPSLIAPSGSVGAVGGIINFSNQISGIVAPILTGYLIAITGTFAWAFAVAAGYLLVGILSYIVLLGRIEPIPFRQVARR